MVPAPLAARFNTDPRLALRPEAEQELVRGLVARKAEGQGSALPPVESFASAARAEAKLLGLKRKAPDDPREGHDDPSESERESEREVDAPTVPLAPKHKKPGSTTVNLRAASKDLTRFAVIAVGLALGAYAVIWWWANRTPGPAGMPRGLPSAEVPQVADAPTVSASAPVPLLSLIHISEPTRPY